MISFGVDNSTKIGNLDIMVAQIVNFYVEGADGIIGFGRNYNTKNREYQVDNNFSVI